MEFWVSLILVEVIPIFMWIVGGICESKSTELKKAKLGYRSKFSGKNKYTWEYANKLVAKIVGSIGTLLFIMNAIIIFMFGVSVILILTIINILLGAVAIFIVEKSLKKKFDSSGNFKNN